MIGNREPHVVAICGSHRSESKTRVVLETVLAAAGERGAQTELLDLRSYDVPALNAVDGPVADAESLRKRVAEADSLVLGTPNYHGSVAGGLKNALDYCGRDEFAGTTVGLVEVAGGAYPGSALAHLRTVSRTLRGWPLPTEVAVPNSRSTIEGGEIRDEDIAERARRLGADLVRYAGVADYPESGGTSGGAGAETDD